MKIFFLAINIFEFHHVIFQQEIIKNVELLLQLNQQLYTTSLHTQKEQLQQRIHYTDDKINQAVYKLYNLTPKEIEIIETAP